MAGEADDPQTLDTHAGKLAAAPGAADDAYEARVDEELANLDERPTAELAAAQEQGLGPYLRSYTRRVLPLAIAVSAWRALDGGSWAQVVAAFVAGTVIAGLVSFGLRGLRRAKLPVDEGAAKDPDAKDTRSAAAGDRDDAYYDGRLDEELEKLDGQG